MICSSRPTMGEVGRCRGQCQRGSRGWIFLPLPLHNARQRGDCRPGEPRTHVLIQPERTLRGRQYCSGSLPSTPA